MSNYQTSVSKSSHYGWKAETSIPLGNNRYIELTTMKRGNGGIQTVAICCKVENGMSSYVLYQDFYKIVLPGSTGLRSTEKNVKAQHAVALLAAPQLIEEVKAYYAAK